MNLHTGPIRKFRWATLLGCALVFVFSADSLAQDSNSSEDKRPPSRIAEFHQRIKKRFSGFGRNRKDESAAQEAVPQTAPQDDTDTSAEFQVTELPEPEVHQAQYQQDITPLQHGPLPSARQLPAEPFYPDGSGYRERQRQFNERLPAYDTPQQPALQASQPAPNHPLRQRVAQVPNYQQPQSYQPSAPANWNPTQPTQGHTGRGYLRNGGPYQGQLASDYQTTATERALQLEAEIRLLKSSRQSLIAENRRLNGIIKKHKQIIANIESAVKDARQELVNASSLNLKLKAKVRMLESKLDMQKQQTAKLLNSIKRELDDVLIQQVKNR